MTQDERRIAENLALVREKIARALDAAGRRKDSARLIAVSKSHDESAVREALAAGQRDFGENRVQEAQAKFPALKRAFPDLTLHLIGPLQSNKAADAIALFDWIHSLDREKLARALAQEIGRASCRERV